ncbi:hypothetical protein FRC09_017207 [Ceratobasidium sp. 395]|nr:hypothetical protein FRC09_017207 [Ceratobasidium sp. 395]
MFNGQLAPAALAPIAPVSAASVASAPGSAPARRGAQEITPIHVEFNICDRPKGTPGKDKFQLKEVLGLSSPVYSSILMNVHEIGVAARLNMRETISKQNKYLLRRVFDTIIQVYPGILEYENPYWVPEALTYVMLKSCVDRYKNNQRAAAKPKEPKHSPKSLLKRQKARREAQRKSALDRAAARKAAKAAAALENPDESIEDMIKGINNTTIQDDEDDDEMAADGPLLPPDLTRTGKKTKVVESRDLSQADVAGPTATEPSVGPTVVPNPAPPKRARPAVRPPPPMDEPAVGPAPVTTATDPATPAPATDSASAPALDSAPAHGSAPAPGSGPAYMLNPADADVAALLASGKEACSRVSASLLPLGPVDFNADNDSELSDEESDSGTKAKGGRRGAKSKGTAASSTAKSAAKSATTGKNSKKGASTAKSAATTAAKESGTKAKSQPATRRTTRSSAKA